MPDSKIVETEYQRSTRLDQIAQYNEAYEKIHQLSYDLTGQELQCCYVLTHWLETRITELKDIL